MDVLKSLKFDASLDKGRYKLGSSSLGAGGGAIAGATIGSHGALTQDFSSPVGTGAMIGSLGDTFRSSALASGSVETSETLVSKDFQARLRTTADELKVRKLDQDATRAQQAELALEISGKALTGLEGAILSFAVQGQKGKAELVSEDGVRLLQLPVEPRSEFADIGYIVGLPDGSKLSVAPEAPWNNNTTSFERTSKDGATLRASFAPGIDDQDSQLTTLVASSNDGKHYVGLHDNGQKDHLILTVASNDYSMPGSITSRSATELGVAPVLQSHLGTMGGFSSFSLESRPLTEAVLRDAAQQVETQNPFLNKAESIGPVISMALGSVPKSKEDDPVWQAVQRAKAGGVKVIEPELLQRINNLKVDFEPITNPDGYKSPRDPF